MARSLVRIKLATALVGNKATQSYTWQSFEEVARTKNREHYWRSPHNMFSAVYQATLRAHLKESQYLTLQILLLLLQTHRQVKLSALASVFPQLIQCRSRKRNLQRVLVLPQLSIKLLWFPLII